MTDLLSTSTQDNTNHGDDPAWQARALADAALLEQRVAQIDALPRGALQAEVSQIYAKYQQLGRLDQEGLYTETSLLLADSLIEVEVYADQQGINCYYFNRHLAMCYNVPVPAVEYSTGERGRRGPPALIPTTIFE